MLRNFRTQFGCVLLLGLLGVVPIAAVHACSICIAYPRKSAADYLIDSPCVVFAREDPVEPFSYAPVEVLKGKTNGKPIDLFLDSQTRRVLASDRKRIVVLAQDGKDGSWRNLGLADAEYAAIVRRIVVFAPQWQGPEGNKRRVEFFVLLFGHKNRLIYELAYLELARAPYSTITKLGRAVPREHIERILSRPAYLDWRSLAILMLAHTGEAKDKQHITESLRSAERFGLTGNLAAWAAASIELQGADAVSFIESRYFRQVDRKQQELVEVVKALSLHGTEGRTEMRDRIVASYAVLLEFHPAMSGDIAKDLIRWKRSELTEQLSAIAGAGESIDPTARNAIRRYLSLATDSNQGERTSD